MGSANSEIDDDPYPIYKVEFEHILQAPAAERYQHFMERVVDWEDASWLASPDGSARLVVEGGRDCLPIWSHPVFAQVFSGHRLANSHAVRVSLDEILGEWLPTFAREGLGVSVFPTPELGGTVVDPLTLKNELEALLRQREEETELEEVVPPAPQGCTPRGEMPPEIAARIRTIKETIDPDRMNACLSEDEVRSFEIERGIDLPLEYRWFLLEVGDGGGLGLWPLGALRRGDHRDPIDALRNLSKPFPFTEQWVWEGEEDVVPGKMESTGHGALVVGADGCGEEWLLIVTGPQRGKIWNWVDVGIGPCEPPHDFLSWLQSRLGIWDGPCPRCGYDLRGTPGRCSECGYGREM